jgi:hypothetical protein
VIARLPDAFFNKFNMKSKKDSKKQAGLIEQFKKSLGNLKEGKIKRVS